MKTRTNHGAEVALESKKPAPFVFVYCSDPDNATLLHILRNAPTNRAAWLWPDAPSWKFHGHAPGFIVKVIPGETLPEFWRMEALQRGGVIERQEFKYETATNKQQ
jgi:hypothetical protein